MARLAELPADIHSLVASEEWVPGLQPWGSVTLFTRGADVNIPHGTQVEMVLQRPLVLEDQNLAGVREPGAAPTLVPAANQPKPITQHRPRIFCPPGSLGCE